MPRMQHEMLEQACGARLGTDGPRAHPTRPARRDTLPKFAASLSHSCGIFLRIWGGMGRGWRSLSSRETFVTILSESRNFESASDLSQRLGLPFKNLALLTRALTHRSYVNENPDSVEDNERLEFLG